MRRHSPGRAFFGVDARTQVLMRSAVTCLCASTMAAVMVVSIGSFCGRVPRSLEWTDQGPRDGCASIAFPQRLGRLFFPCRQAAAFLAGQKKPSAAVLRDALGLTA